jgi:flavodoxin
MKGLVLFDSVYGNTKRIAEEIGSVLGKGGDVKVLPVAGFLPEQLQGMDLLVAGSPTQGFAPIQGTKNFLKALKSGQLNGIKIAAFDTRVDIKVVNSGFLTFMGGIFGYAAEKIYKRLKVKGGTPVIAPAGFFVTDREGPLAPGEIERAAAWAEEIIRKL